MGEFVSVKGLPSKPVTQLSAGQRAIGRLASIRLPVEGEIGEAQSDLAGDVFHQLYQADPKLAGEVPEERAVNKALLEWVQETHGWEQSRASTRGNMPASMAASTYLWANLTNDETIKEALAKQDEAEKAKKEAEAAEKAANALEKAAAQAGLGTAKGEGLSQQAAAARKQAREKADQAKAAAQAAGELVDKAKGSPLRQASVAKAAREAAEVGKEMAEASAGWGFGPGSAVATDPGAAMKFMEANKGKIARIAKLAGRMRGFALQAKSEQTPTGVTPKEANLTQDFMRLFPTELALLRPDAPANLRVQKMAQFAEVGLLGYRPNGQAEKRGEFVAATDDSGSMNGERDIVAKAVALGLAQTAKQDGRAYKLYTFSTRRDPMTEVSGEDRWEKHVEWASSHGGGGTDFNYMLETAIEHLRSLPSGGKNADLLIISDGEAGVADSAAIAWKEFSKETGARLFYVPVGLGGYLDIENLADRVYPVTELDEQTGADLASELGGRI